MDFGEVYRTTSLAWKQHRAGVEGATRLRLGTELSGYFVLGIVVIIATTMIVYSLPHALLYSRASKLFPLFFVHVYQYLPFVSTAGYAIALCCLWIGMPCRLILDGEAGTLEKRRWLHRSVFMPLSDIDGAVLVLDQEGTKRCYYVLTFRKDLMLPAIPISGSCVNPAEITQRKQETIAALQNILANRREESKRETGSAASYDWTFGTHWLALGGGRHYRLYGSFPKLVWNLFVSNALCLAAVYWVHSNPAVVPFFNSVFQNELFSDRMKDYFACAMVCLVALDILLCRVGLRIDSETGTASLYRCLGLLRSDYPRERFNAFVLWHSQGRPGLYLAVSGLQPSLLLSGSKDSDRLRRILLETADALGVDPWASLRTHPEPYDPAPRVTEPGRLARWFVEKTDASLARLEGWLDETRMLDKVDARARQLFALIEQRLKRFK